MTYVRITKLLLLFAIMNASWCAAQQAQIPSLQLTIQQASPKQPLQVDLLNVGDKPLHLLLGFKHPHGDMVVNHYTISLYLTDEQGKVVEDLILPALCSKTSSCRQLHEPVAGGGIDQVGAPLLQPGQTYSISVDPSTYVLPRAPGRYTLWARYHNIFAGGETINPYNIPPDYKFLPPVKRPYWKGTVTSNPLPITIPAQ